MNEESRPARRLPDDHSAAHNNEAGGRYAAPAVLIRFELEAPPRLLVDALDEREHDRLVDWISTHPAYLKLVQDAIELAARERAA